jgi:DnaJ-class molecular chaperone
MSQTHPTHRGGECPTCEGEGQVNRPRFLFRRRPGFRSPKCHECPNCDGRGDYEWAWQTCGTGDCTSCPARDVEVLPWGEDGEEFVCESCALAIHARCCGCDKWPKVPEESDRE